MTPVRPICAILADRAEIRRTLDSLRGFVTQLELHDDACRAELRWQECRFPRPERDEFADQEAEHLQCRMEFDTFMRFRGQR